MIARFFEVFSTESTESDAADLIAELLVPSEVTVWIKRPSRRVPLEPRELAFMRATRVYAFIAAVMVVIVGVSFLGVFPGTGTVVSRTCFIAVWLIVFGGLFLNRVYLRARRSNHIYYALTTRRVLIVDVIARRILHDLMLRTMDMPRATDFGGGTGTITFGPPPPPLSYWNEHRQMADEFLEGLGFKETTPALKLVDDVSDVLYDVLIARAASFHELSAGTPSA